MSAHLKAVSSDGFRTAQDAARALLSAAWRGEMTLTWKASSFAGQVSTATEPLTDRQAEWLGQMLERAGLPPLIGGKTL
jgi:hypothetical protein